MGERQPVLVLFSKQKSHNPECGYSLADDGRECGSLHAQTQSKNKNRVKNQVQHSSDDSRPHGGSRESQGTDKSVHSSDDHGEQHTEEVNPQVALRVDDGVVAGSEEVEYRYPEQIAESENHNGREQNQGKHIAKDGLRIFLIPCAARDGKQRSAAGAEEVGES